MGDWTQPVAISEYQEHRLVCFRSPSCWYVLVSSEGERPSMAEGPDRETAMERARAAIDHRLLNGSGTAETSRRAAGEVNNWS